MPRGIAGEPRGCVICGKPLIYDQKNGCSYAHGKQALRSREPVRGCGVCGKPLLRRQKAGCCLAHGKQAQVVAVLRTVPDNHSCVVCGVPLVKRFRESWARFAARKGCSRTCGAVWSADKRRGALLRSLAAGRRAAERTTAENWP